MAASGRSLFSLYIYIENLKNLLVRNHCNDCNIMWQKCSFGYPVPRLFKSFGFVQNHGRQWAGLIFPIYLYRKTWKNLLVRNHLTDFIITWQKCLLGDPLPRLFRYSWFVRKHGCKGWSLFPLYIYIENLKKSSCQKPLDRFHYTLAETFRWWRLPRLFMPSWFVKTWLVGAGLIFPIYIYIENLKKSSCQKPLDRFQYNLADMFPRWPFIKIVHDLSKNMAGRGWGLFSPYIYIENFNDLLVRNHWTDFNLTLQKCFLCNPLSRLCKPSWFIKKQGSQGAGLIFPIYLYR